MYMQYIYLYIDTYTHITYHNLSESIFVDILLIKMESRIFVPLSPHYNIMMPYISSTFIDKHIRLHNSFLTQFIKLKGKFQEEKQSPLYLLFFIL